MRVQVMPAPVVAAVAAAARLPSRRRQSSFSWEGGVRSGCMPLKPVARAEAGARYAALYDSYEQNVRWIQRQADWELAALPKAVKEVADFYFNKRLKATSDAPYYNISPMVGRPLPYLAFWLCDDLGVDDERVRRTLGLALIFASISVSAYDDLLEGALDAVSHRLFIARYFWARHASLVAELAGDKLKVHELLVVENISHIYGEVYSLFSSYPVTVNPLSEKHISKFSQYLVSVCYPSLAAIFIMKGNSDALPSLNKFLHNYCMGWRIVDDMRDCRDDLLRGDAGKSAVISYVMWHLKLSRIDLPTLTAALLEPEILEGLYKAIDRHYKAAARVAREMNSQRLLDFVVGQREGHRVEQARFQSFRDGLCAFLNGIEHRALTPDLCPR
ncbi:MAG: hypothetical protein PW843_28490 [Azospirillaceae bacterium]|nr:hypothetical protein [Azospirillaceae bacterium]